MNIRFCPFPVSRDYQNHFRHENEALVSVLVDVYGIFDIRWYRLFTFLIKRDNLSSWNVLRGFPRVLFRSETVTSYLVNVLSVLGVAISSGLVDFDVENLIDILFFRNIFCFFSCSYGFINMWLHFFFFLPGSWELTECLQTHFLNVCLIDVLRYWIIQYDFFECQWSY